MEPEDRTIAVQSIQEAKNEAGGVGENRQLYARVAFFYSQYTLEEVEALPYRDLVLLLNTATKIEAERMYNLTMIASAPQSKNGKGVKTLMEHFKGLVNK